MNMKEWIADVIRNPKRIAVILRCYLLLLIINH